ncbi:hypothetical protein SUGI_0120020 [Cryptomeria japonica]|nr:hypothetical protein SUGI_0120020 [Cryptomeria japonica]
MQVAQKKQRIEEDLSRSTSIMSSSSSLPKATGTSKESGTLKSLWKPVEKQQVDDALADLFYTSAIPFNVARNPHFHNAIQKVAEFGKGYTPPTSEAFRTSLLERSKERVTEKLAEVKASWKFPWIYEAIHRGRALANFIRNHRLTLSLYRQHASRELLRPCDTRFASFYITLKRVVEEKAALRSVVCSNEWENSVLSKSAKGKNIEQIVLNSSFWESGTKVLSICEPIVDVLRMVDGDKPCLGMLYESMDRCKEAIQRALNNVDAEYMEIWAAVDSRWKMMHTPLHAAACYLEPKLFHIDRQADFEIMAGFYEAISKFELDPAIASLIRDQSWLYKRAEGLFGVAGAEYDMK